MAEQVIPPAYIGYQSFLNTIKMLAPKGSLPDRIDGTVLTSLNGSTKAQFIAALRFLGLIDPGGKPTANFQKLIESSAHEPHRKAFMASMLKLKYGAQLDALKSGTPGSLKESFGDIGPSLVAPAARFLLQAAEDADLPVSPHIKAAGIPSPKKPRKARVPGDGPEGGEADLPEQPEVNPLHTALIAKFPEFRPDWSPEERKVWMEMYAEIFKITKSVGAGNP